MDTGMLLGGSGLVVGEGSVVVVLVVAVGVEVGAGAVLVSCALADARRSCWLVGTAPLVWIWSAGSGVVGDLLPLVVEDAAPGGVLVTVGLAPG